MKYVIFLYSLREKLYYKSYPLLWADHVKLIDWVFLFLQFLIPTSF